MEKFLKENKKLVILWGVLILAIIVVLIITNISKKPKKEIATNTRNDNTYVQTEAKEDESKDEGKKIVFSQSSVVLDVGSSETITLKEGEKTGLTWTSTNPNIASVSNEGTVTAMAMGTAVITGQTSNGESSRKLYNCRKRFKCC